MTKAEAAYLAYAARLAAVEKQLGLYLADVCVDRENAVDHAEGSYSFWEVMLSSAQGSAQSRLEEHGIVASDFGL